MSESSARPPRFKVGDNVLALGPSQIYRGKQGVIVEVVDAPRDLVYRYKVKFPDDAVGTFFGFELQSEEPS
ncbi:MAG TPA: hypothetical protein VE422_12130 [Terriglobia bacterium]|nr:hypothetical protein [Terriglobia bacterium]